MEYKMRVASYFFMFQSQIMLIFKQCANFSLRVSSDIFKCFINTKPNEQYKLLRWEYCLPLTLVISNVQINSKNLLNLTILFIQVIVFGFLSYLLGQDHPNTYKLIVIKYVERLVIKCFDHIKSKMMFT